jgi:multisubunit Na+/H+ antiporter MnhC subunit
MSSAGETMDRLFMAVMVTAIVVAMAGWVYALGWVALKLIQFV